MDQITSCYAIDDLHSADDLPKDGVTSVQMRLRRVCDEKLAPAGVLARESHPDSAASVRPGIDLAADLIAGSPFAIAARIAPLNNEIRYDAMKSQVIEVVSARERDEAVHRDRRVLREEFDADLALSGVNRGSHRFVESCGNALVKELVVACLNDADAAGEIAQAHLFQ